MTVGATANFDALIKAVLSPPFLKALQTSDYTDLVLQHGKGGGKIFQDFAAENPPNSKGRYGLDIIGFGFNKAGLDVEMRAAKGKGNAEGIVISHAGVPSR